MNFEQSFKITSGAPLVINTNSPFLSSTIIEYLILEESKGNSEITLNFLISFKVLCPALKDSAVSKGFKFCNFLLSDPLTNSVPSSAYKIALSLFEEIIFSKDNLFSVKVPVLSVQRISIFPKSSIADNLFTTTFSLAIFKLPRDKDNITIAGRASGKILTIKAIQKSEKLKKLLVPLIIKFNKNIKIIVITTIFKINRQK